MRTKSPNALRLQITTYLVKHPEVTLPKLATRAGINRSSLWAFLKGKTKTLPNTPAILKAIDHRPDVKILRMKARMVQQGYKQADFDRLADILRSPLLDTQA